MAPDDITPGDGNGEGPLDEYEYIEEVVEYKDNRRVRTLLAVLLALLLLLLAGLGYLVWNSTKVIGGPAGKAATGKMVWVRSIYGWGTAPDQQLSAPTSVATAPDGTIWANSSNKLAVAFTSVGQLDRLIRSNPATSTSQEATGNAKSSGSHAGATSKAGSGGVQAIFSLDVDSNDNLFIGDDAQGNVLKFTTEGRLIKGWSVPGLGKMAANDSFVAVTGTGNIGAFSQTTGAPVFAFGSRGQGKNQFDLPAGIHIDGQNYVYVADTQNQRVRKYTPSGKLLWDAGTVPQRKFQTHVEAPKGIFQLPTGVTTDGNNRVVVIDAFNYNITVLDGSTGKLIATYGTYGQDDGQFDNPSGIAYDRVRDYFVVADTGNNRLQVVRIPGSSAALTPSTLLSRALANPIWILCLPFIILLIAILVTAMLNRRRKKIEAEG